MGDDPSERKITIHSIKANCSRGLIFAGIIIYSSDQFSGFQLRIKQLNPRASVMCITYNLMSTLPVVLKEKWAKDIKKENEVQKKRYVPIARMIACKQYPKCNKDNKFERPSNMLFTFEHFRYDRNDKVCIHWPIDVPGVYYSRRPCKKIKTNMTHTVCDCHTWGIVTVIGRLAKPPAYNRYVRYELGKNCFLSVLLVTIGLVFTLFYLLLKDQWGAAVYEVFTRKEYDSGRLLQLHIVLQTCLVEFFFLIITFDVEANVGVCFFFALLFYYLVQTVFFWLFVYTLFLHTRLKEIFDSSRYNSYKIYLFIGYGIPFVVMLTISGLEFQNASQGVCWLLFRGTTVWGFSSVIVTLGVVSLVLLLQVAYKARKMENGAILQEKCLRTMFTTFFILLTAVFGTTALQERNYLSEWLFALCNLLQGSSITIMFCILRREDALIKANQIGALPFKKEDMENDELQKQFQAEEDEEILFADMSADDESEEENGNDESEKAPLPRNEERETRNDVKGNRRRERVVRFDEEEENQETTVDEPHVVESESDEDNEMEFMEFDKYDNYV